MTPRKHHLVFNGYWREQNKVGIPAARGIFCVYNCVFDAEKKIVALQSLVYVGASDNARLAVVDHPRQPEWNQRVAPGQQLCYTFAPIPDEDMEPIKDALVQRGHPALTDGNRAVATVAIHVTTEGANAFLAS